MRIVSKLNVNVCMCLCVHFKTKEEIVFYEKFVSSYRTTAATVAFWCLLIKIFFTSDVI